MTEKEALLKSIAMWEFIKKEHLNKDGKHDLVKHSNICSNASIVRAKVKYLSKYEYLDIKAHCYLCEYAFQQQQKKTIKEKYCNYCPVKNWHIYRNKGRKCDMCCKHGSVYLQANKFQVIEDTLELLKETYNNLYNKE